jgi:hypothetical protein
VLATFWIDRMSLVFRDALVDPRGRPRVLFACGSVPWGLGFLLEPTICQGLSVYSSSSIPAISASGTVAISAAIGAVSRTVAGAVAGDGAEAVSGRFHVAGACPVKRS